MASTKSREELLVIVGPTAVGKTATSIEVARLIDGEVVSADSMQVYQGMDIGTGKVQAQDTRGIRHHLLDLKRPGQSFSVAQYVELADAAIADIRSRGKIPIVVGGTGLYIRSLIDGLMFEEPGPDYQLRSKLKAEAISMGNDYLHQRLQQIDPEAAARIHPNDLKRVIRALEVFYITGVTISEKIAQSKLAPPRYKAAFYGLNAPRPILYERINARVDEMLASGLVQEVMKLLSAGFHAHLTSAQAIGYKELVAYVRGDCTYAQAVEELKKGTRNYAKRQLSWFGRDKRIKWFDITKYPGVQAIADEIVKDFEKGNPSHKEK